LEDGNLVDYAEELGLDAKRLITEVRNSAHAARIQKDFRSGEQMGVNGTPTFFANGEPFEGEPSADELIAALTERIK
jgi:protein-disulfide isomerase